MPEPIYTADNCRQPAYQLNWSYSLFWHEKPRDASWLELLQAATEADGIRILQHEFGNKSVSQFLVSTRPHVSPQFIAQRLKGRLQHLVKDIAPAAFQRNYSIRSVGTANREQIDRYLLGQLEHHPPADDRVAEKLKRFQIHNRSVDLSQPTPTSHAISWYNLHVVVVNDGRYREIRDEPLQALHDMIIKVSSAKGYGLSRAAILPDHTHLALRCKIDDAPESVALSFLNNLAFACGMKPIFRFGYYVGTFGEYDLGAI